VIGNETAPALIGRNAGERRRKRGLAMVDVTDRADIAMRQDAVELFSAHGTRPF